MKSGQPRAWIAAGSCTQKHNKRSPGYGLLLQRMSPQLCRFSAAGRDNLTTRCDDRRLKSAKARSRGKLGTGRAASAMEI